MITVFSQVKIYCEENNIPLASRQDMSGIGKMVGTHFRRFWGINQPADIISQAGFIFSEEKGRPILVIGYPDCFADEMKGRIDLYFVRKTVERLELEQKQAVQPEKVTKSVTTKERKRIPYKAKPKITWSAKPENPNMLKTE